MSDDRIKDEDRITRRDLLQANATLITGVLIFLSIFMGLRSDKISNEIASINWDKALGILISTFTFTDSSEIANLLRSYFFFLLSIAFFLLSIRYVLLERPVKTGKLDALGMAKGCIMAGIIFIIFSITYLMSIILGTIIACIIGIIIIQIIRSIIRHSHPNKPS
jgi:hypothetical protein